MSCERHKFYVVDNIAFCEVCGEAPTPEQSKRIFDRLEAEDKKQEESNV